MPPHESPRMQWRRQLGLGIRTVRYAVDRRGRREALDTLFRVVNGYLRDLEVDYFLTFGTLLGQWREGRLLAHDRDVDFGVIDRGYARVWAERHRLPPGFAMHDTSRHHHGPKLYVSYRRWEADLYFYRESGTDLLPCIVSELPEDTASILRELVLPTRLTTMLGEVTRVPADPEGVLRLFYRYLGPNAVRDPVTGYFRPRTLPDRLGRLAPWALLLAGLWWARRR